MISAPSSLRVLRTTRTTVKTYAECDESRLEAFVEAMEIMPGACAVSLSPGFGYIFIDHDATLDPATIAELSHDVGYIAEARGSATVGPVAAKSPSLLNFGTIATAALFALVLGAFASAGFSKFAHAGPAVATAATVTTVADSRTIAFTYARDLGH